MNITSHLKELSSVIINPLKKDENVAALKAFIEIIKTSIGPCGKLKIIQNAAGGHVTVTSSSQRLLHIVCVKNTFLRMIVSSAKVHLTKYGDGGLSCIFLTLNLINNSSSLIYPLPLIGKLYEHFGNIFVNYLTVEHNSSVISLDVSDLKSFQSVVQTVLHSKPGCILKQSDVHHLSILLLKVLLNSLPSTVPLIYHKNINFVTLEGTNCDRSQLYDGLLIKLSEKPVRNLNYLKNKSSIKIVLFTTSLSGDAEFPVDNIEVYSDVLVWDTILKFLKNVIQKVINAEVHILACQKVVHPSLRKQLEDANILVLDRLGYEVTKHLEYLSGSSNSSLFNEISIGSVTCINKETIGKSNFLHLSNKLKPFWTMLICNFNEQTVNETKVVCQQVIDTLFRLLKKPIVCYGAGCTEIYTTHLVKKKVLETLEEIKQEIGCTTTEVLETLKVFLQSITELAIAFHQGCTLNFVTETVHNHLWKLNDGKFPSKYDKCVCGQFTATFTHESNWSFLTKSLSNLILESSTCTEETQEDLDRSVILDELNAKINAYSVAFETASLLMRVAVCVKS